MKIIIKFHPFTHKGIKHADTMVRTSNEEDSITEVKLYNTLIVKFSRKGVILNASNHLTTLTKRRMNQVSQGYGLGFSIVQEKFKWYVWFNAEKIPFKNYMMLHFGG